MKHIITLCVLLGVCITAWGQVVTIRNQENSKALENVSLTSEEPAAATTTDASGVAEVKAFAGSQRIEIRLTGFHTEILSYYQLEQLGFTVLLSPAGVSLNQVVLSASRWKQPRREVPMRITTITPAEIALQNPQTAADMLALSGEVFIQKSQLGGGSPMIRGFSTNRLLMTVDGVRMNTAIFRSGNLQNVISLDPFAIEGSEILFGPGSVIYGSDAIGGVMSFETLSPVFSLTGKPVITGKAVARHATANSEATAHFDINIGGRKWAAVTSFTHSRFDDLRMGSNGPDEYLRPFYTQRQDSIDVVVTNDDPLIQRPTGYSQINMMQKMSYAPSEQWNFTYGFHYSTTSTYSRYDRLVRYRNGLPRSAEWYYGPQKWMMNNLTATHHTNNILFDQLNIRAAHQLFKESRIDRDMNDNERRTRIEKVNAYSANLDFLKSPGARNKLFYGVELVFNKVQSTGLDQDISTGEIVPGPARYPQSDWASYAAYLSWQHHFSERLLIQGGVRYNRFMLNALFDTSFYPLPYTKADINKGAFTGSLGAVFNPTEKWSVSANFSTGFRSPNVDDAGKVFDSEPGSVIIPNPDLNAEYTYNAEAGIAKVFGSNVKADLTVYYTILENAMVRRNFSLNGADSIVYDGELSQVLAIQNAAKATVYGIQMGIDIKLPQGFGIFSRFNYQHGEEELDDGSTSPLRHAAPWFGTTHLTLKTGKLHLDWYALYNGEVAFDDLPQEEQSKDYIYALDDAGNPYSPAWFTLNFKAMYALNNTFSVTAGLENILDLRYRPYSSGIVAPGRNFIISARANF